jgi:Ca2+-binding EF-hand superfamily protein
VVRQGISPAHFFQKVDLDRNGRLSWEEVKRVVLSFQPDLSLTEQQLLFRKFDRDGNGEIDVNEFCALLNGCRPEVLLSIESKIRALGEKLKTNYGQYSWADMFNMFDQDRDGRLTRVEWLRVGKLLCPDLTEQDLSDVFNRFDVDRNGCLQLVEFENFFREAIERTTVGSRTPTSSMGLGSMGLGSMGLGSMGLGSAGLGSMATSSVGLSSMSSASYGVMPPAYTPPYEEPWEKQVLDNVRSELLSNQSGVGGSRLGISDVFRRLDIDKNGSISMSEFDRIIRTYHPDLQEFHVAKLFSLVNVSGNGHIGMNEFVRRFG